MSTPKIAQSKEKLDTPVTKVRRKRTVKKPADKARYYVDNAVFQEAMVNYHTKCQEARAKGLDIPRASDYIGSCIMKVAQGFSTSHMFVGYMFREDMVLYAVENCVKALPNYDPTVYFNPHAYFSMVTWRAFLRYIEDEKRAWYLKHKNMLRMLMYKDMMETLSGGHAYNDIDTYDGTSTMSTMEFMETSLTIVNEYETKMARKKLEKEQKRLSSKENEDR